LAPDVFEPDERGHVGMALQGNLPALLEPDTRIGVHNCPESALRLVSDVVEGFANHSRHAELAEQSISKLTVAETTW
jgi:hypothetical protein